jgi:hypothetical protein
MQRCVQLGIKWFLFSTLKVDILFSWSYSIKIREHKVLLYAPENLWQHDIPLILYDI